MPFIEACYTYFQTALLLGVSRRDIFEWIARGELKASTDGHYIQIYEKDIVEFLKDHPECVGRVYCNDLPIFEDARKRIVEQISL